MVNNSFWAMSICQIYVLLFASVIVTFDFQDKTMEMQIYNTWGVGAHISNIELQLFMESPIFEFTQLICVIMKIIYSSVQTII